MKVNILAFGIAREILGSSSMELEVGNSTSVSTLKEELSERFPKFKSLVKFDLAVNEEYRSDDFGLTEGDEVAIIPPVSGG